MSKLLNSTAVGQKTGDEAAEILGAYVETGPGMLLNHTPGGMNKQPKGTSAGDHLIDPY